PPPTRPTGLFRNRRLIGSSLFGKTRNMVLSKWSTKLAILRALRGLSPWDSPRTPVASWCGLTYATTSRRSRVPQPRQPIDILTFCRLADPIQPPALEDSLLDLQTVWPASCSSLVVSEFNERRGVCSHPR